MFFQAIAFALANSEGFLHWAGPSRPLRVLYVDGEMSRRQMKRRILDALRRSGGKKPESLFVLSKEDAESLPPLNTPEGQAWMDTFIEQHGGFDLIIFDNLQSLLTGNMKDEEQWAEVLPWVQDLTRRAIGQVWLHHTGHEEGRGYGSKAREWGMDLVGLMERVANTPKGELWFSLKFTKARERGPENLDDFDEVTLKLIDDKWSSDKGKIAILTLSISLLIKGLDPFASFCKTGKSLIIKDLACLGYHVVKGKAQNAGFGGFEIGTR
jgi:AAA domain